MNDYYSILGVPKGAPSDEIKKAYRRMASQHHPDKGGDTEKFQQIEEAYRVLSDDQKRAEYDTPQQQFQDPFGPFMNQQGFDSIFKHFGNQFGDMFGGGPRNRNRTLNLQTTISLEEAFYGKELIANVTLPSGKEQIINVKIPAGIQDNTVLRLSGMGEDTFQNSPRGDIHLTITIAEHPLFHRQGDDLIQEMTMPIWFGILGETVKVTTLDKKEYEMKINPGTQFGQTLSIQSAGMPNMQNPLFRGRLLIRVKFTIPDNLTEDQKNKIRDIIL
jgi:DnaJ-class molecular chaperone